MVPDSLKPKKSTFMQNYKTRGVVLFIFQETECENEQKSGTVKHIFGGSSRTITLQMLLDAKILQPGEGAMTIEYLVSVQLSQKSRMRDQKTVLTLSSL